MFYIVNDSGIVSSGERILDMSKLCSQMNMMTGNDDREYKIVSAREYKREKLLKKYTSIFGLNFIYKPYFNQRIITLTANGKIDFFVSKAFAERTLYSQAKNNGFNSINLNSDYNWSLYKTEDDILVELQYIEGDVYLTFIYDDEVKMHYFQQKKEA